MPSTVIRMPANGQNRMRGNGGGAQSGGIQICCCRVFTCVNLGFITSKEGLLKLAEVILGSLCQTLLVRFGLPSAEDIGQAFNSFLTTASSCLMTSTILFICYMVSIKSFHLIRQSLFVRISSFLLYLLLCSLIITCIILSFHEGGIFQCSRLFSVFERIVVHGFRCKFLAVSTIRNATSVHGISSDDGRLCEFSIFTMRFFFLIE